MLRSGISQRSLLTNVGFVATNHSSLIFMNDDRDLYSGMIRLHVLHHAEKGTIFGAGMSEELARHGYKISPGTMYPILHGLEKRGYLQSSEERSGKSLRRVYRITASGRRALNRAKLRVRELFGELIEGK